MGLRAQARPKTPSARESPNSTKTASFQSHQTNRAISRSTSPGTPSSTNASNGISRPRRRRSHSRGKETFQRGDLVSPREVNQYLELPSSFKESLSLMEDLYGTESMPTLVDDHVIRRKLEGERAGRQWNIEEDTPGGHAEDTLVLVPGIENDQQSFYLDNEDSEVLDEDDDIIDDPDEHSLVIARTRTTGSLPRDPSFLSQSHQFQNSVADRFNPSFNNLEMWDTDAHHHDVITPISSGDVSVLSGVQGIEDWEPGSERESNTVACTMDNLEKLFLSEDEAVEDKQKMASQDYIAVEGKLSKIEPTGYYSPKESRDGTGRSSTRRKPGKGRKKRDALRARIKRKGSAAEPTMLDPSDLVKTPVSPSSTSNSQSLYLSLLLSQPQAPVDDSQEDKIRSPKRTNSLNLHVGRGSDFLRATDCDEDTIGASTITTNFSTTQRTRGDNTVSTRSLFKSDQMSFSATPKLPRRVEADSDSESSESEDLPPKMNGIDSTVDYEVQLEGSLDNPFNQMAVLMETPRARKRSDLFVRRPSGGEDSALAQSISDFRSKFTLEGNEFNDNKEEDSLNQNEHVWHAPDSPTELLKKVKKKRSLFGRRKSWKGVVPLGDDDET